MEIEQALENMLVGMGLAVAQTIMTVHPWFDEAQIRDYIQTRRLFHATLSESCVVLADYAADNPILPESVLRQMAKIPPSRTGQLLLVGARVFRGLARFKVTTLNNTSPNLKRNLYDMNTVISLMNKAERNEYEQVGMLWRDLLKRVVKIPTLPPRIKTLFREFQRLPLTEPLPEEADPGVWFEMTPVERVRLKDEATQAEQEKQMLLDAWTAYEDKDQWREALETVSQRLADIQGKAGVNLNILRRGYRSLLVRRSFVKGKCNEMAQLNLSFLT